MAVDVDGERVDDACAADERREARYLVTRGDERRSETLVFLGQVLDLCLQLRKPGLFPLPTLEGGWRRMSVGVSDSGCGITLTIPLEEIFPLLLFGLRLLVRPPCGGVGVVVVHVWIAGVVHVVDIVVVVVLVL